MSFTFKCYTDGMREFYQWKSDGAKRAVKKDYEFAQNLLDLLELDMDDYYDTFNGMGDEVRKLCEDRNYDTRSLRKSFDGLAKKHIYFEFLRLQWFDLLDAYIAGEPGSLYFKDLTHIPMKIITWQNEIKSLMQYAFDRTVNAEKSVQKAAADLYAGKVNKARSVFAFGSLKTGFERIDEYTMTEVCYPQSMRDMLDFTLREIIRREVGFKVCKSCGKYFPANVHGNTEFCGQVFQDTGKTCRDIGSMAKWKEKVASSPAILLYNKYYKTRFSRIKAGKITREAFLTWAEKARDLRDMVMKGEMAIEDYDAWLKSGRWGCG